MLMHMTQHLPVGKVWPSGTVFLALHDRAGDYTAGAIVAAPAGELHARGDAFDGLV